METLDSPYPEREPLDRARDRVLDALDQLTQALDRLSSEMRRGLRHLPRCDDVTALQPVRRSFASGDDA